MSTPRHFQRKQLKIFEVLNCDKERSYAMTSRYVDVHQYIDLVMGRLRKVGTRARARRLALHRGRVPALSTDTDSVAACASPSHRAHW